MRFQRLLGGLMAMVFVASVAANEPVVIKFSLVVSPDTPKGRAALRFKQLAEDATEGRVKVEVYPNAELYDDREELKALQTGAVQMLAPSLSKLEPLGDFELFDLPYLFPNRKALYAVMDGDVGAALLAKLESNGIHGLAYWDNGFKHMSANWPLRTPADCIGLKLRVQSSDVLKAQMRALDAVPVVMSFGAVRGALAEGLLDGTENPLSNLYVGKIHEVQKHLIMSGHGYLGYAVIVNKKFWDGLPPPLHTVLEQAMVEATRYQRELAQRETEEAFEKIKAAGTTKVYVPTAQVLSSWRQALLPVHKKFEGRIGKDRLASVYRITAGMGDTESRPK
jgi:C4-dicarboxylate-binding protein DctP